jgi:adenosylcobinamide kinase/adenosylcobinamide-phosphate guanylyltransferase
MKALILGGARSGKTRRAMELAAALAARRRYVATAEVRDEEMALRVARHRAERDGSWATVEEPLEVGAHLAFADGVVVVDCLTLWLTNVMLGGRPLPAATDELLSALEVAPNAVVFVLNEVGMGIVPDSALGRAFRDASGRLAQRVGARCERVEVMFAGIALPVKA